jgi:hypothetical protein
VGSRTVRLVRAFRLESSGERRSLWNATSHTKWTLRIRDHNRRSWAPKKDIEFQHEMDDLGGWSLVGWPAWWGGVRRRERGKVARRLGMGFLVSA